MSVNSLQKPNLRLQRWSDVPVILFAEPPLQAEIMMRSSMMVSLILGLPDCTTKTSFSRTLVRMRTLVSPLENWVSSASARAMPRLWHILSVMSGQELPAKIRVPRMVSGGAEFVVRGRKLELFSISLEKKRLAESGSDQNFRSERPASGGRIKDEWGGWPLERLWGTRGGKCG